jgi:hypothetical protein
MQRQSSAQSRCSPCPSFAPAPPIPLDRSHLTDPTWPIPLGRSHLASPSVVRPRLTLQARQYSRPRSHLADPTWPIPLGPSHLANSATRTFPRSVKTATSAPGLGSPLPHTSAPRLGPPRAASALRVLFCSWSPRLSRFSASSPRMARRVDTASIPRRDGCALHSWFGFHVASHAGEGPRRRLQADRYQSVFPVRPTSLARVPVA